ncbi:hypothetical protein [uncultured Shewanella sp.]|uniref:hypothetical protein n=1 Tax=uncultured Shewanella sp. TaxID=173975 RepID=UPI002635E8E8|nr:hypothetical protein [uncultured Shewanella sp.]
MNGLITFSSWKKAGVFLILNFILQAAILFFVYPLVSSTVEPLDVQISLNPEIIKGFFNTISLTGLEIYRLNEMTVDMVFPLIYAFAYSLLLIELMKSCHVIHSTLKYIALLPFVIALFDVLENINIILAINQFPEVNHFIYKLIFVANLSKHIMTLIVLSALLILIVCLAVSKATHRLMKKNSSRPTGL